MPINFEPQADISAAKGYGASLARREDRDFNLRAAGQAAEQGYRMSALSQADDHFQAQLADQRGQSIMHEQGQMARQESGQSHQEYMAKLGAQLESNKLNQAEDIRRQRLERQVDYITANSGEGKKFSAEAGSDMITMLRTDLNPLQMKLQQQQIQQHEYNRQMQLDYHAQQTTLQDMGQSATLGNAQEDPRFVVRDGNGQITHRIVPDGTGRLVHLDVRQQTPATPRPEISSADILRDLQPRGGSSSGESTGGGIGGLAAVPTQSQLEAAAVVHGQAADVARRAQDDLRRRTPGGPLPFARISPNRDLTRQPITGTERGQQLINAAVLDADKNHDNDRSELIRSIAGEIRSGRTTGQLTPEQQQTLQGIGYYRGEFTPALDRELARIESPPSEQVPGRLDSGSGVTMRRVAPEAVKTAARGIRDLLGAHQSVAAMPPNERAQFNSHLAAIRVFNWGRNEEEQKGSRRAPNDPPARQAPPRVVAPNPLSEALRNQSQYRS